MQVQPINNQNKNINFSGLYKIPAKGIGETVSNLVEKRNLGLVLTNKFITYDKCCNSLIPIKIFINMF